MNNLVSRNTQVFRGYLRLRDAASRCISLQNSRAGEHSSSARRLRAVGAGLPAVRNSFNGILAAKPTVWE
jgi:hypothetical protein